MAAPEDLRARACVEHMVSITYERMDDFLKDEASNPDQPNRDISFGKDESTNVFLDLRRSDGKMARILLLNSATQVAQAIMHFCALNALTHASSLAKRPASEDEPGPSNPKLKPAQNRVSVQRFPDESQQSLEECTDLFLPRYRFAGRVSIESVGAAVLELIENAEKEQQERLEMQARLNNAYVECQNESPAMDTYHLLQTWTSAVRLNRRRYCPELLRDRRCRAGAGSGPDLGISEDGVIVDLLLDDWKT